jgi:glyceraldehyde 3-phosphate dehydrogenase
LAFYEVTFGSGISWAAAVTNGLLIGTGLLAGPPAVAVTDSGAGARMLAKVFGWYDNEWGYACRLADLAALVGARR